MAYNSGPGDAARPEESFRPLQPGGGPKCDQVPYLTDPELEELLAHGEGGLDRIVDTLAKDALLRVICDNPLSSGTGISNPGVVRARSNTSQEAAGLVAAALSKVLTQLATTMPHLLSDEAMREVKAAMNSAITILERTFQDNPMEEAEAARLTKAAINKAITNLETNLATGGGGTLALAQSPVLRCKEVRFSTDRELEGLLEGVPGFEVAVEKLVKDVLIRAVCELVS